MNKWHVAANVLSATRFFVPLVLFLPGFFSISWKLLITSFFISTDFIDGWLARKGGDGNPLGEKLDHGSDKVVVVSLGIFFFIHKLVFLEIIFLVIFLETIIFSLSFVILKLSGKIIVNRIGRAKMLFFCAGLVLVWLDQIYPNELISDLSAVSFISGIILSSVLVIIYFAKIMKLIICED